MSTREFYVDLSKEILWVSVGQRAAELPAIKVGGLKKTSACRLGLNPSCPQRAERQNLIDGSSAAL